MLGEESFELGAQFLTAGQILVAGQQGSVLLRGDERVVLTFQRRDHLCDLR